MTFHHLGVGQVTASSREPLSTHQCPSPLCFGSPLRILTYRTTLYLKYHTQSHVLLWKLDFTRYLGNVIDFQSLKKMIVKNNRCNLSINHQSMTYYLLSLIYQCSVIYLSAIYLVYMYLSSILSLSSTIYYHLSITCLYVSINQSSLIYLSSIN